MVLLGDQPMIGEEIIDRMIGTYKKSDKEIIAATYLGKRGHPLLFGSKYFSEVLEYTEENSLRDLLERHPEDVLEMETDSPEILRDIDTEKDYREELKHHQKYD
jgi:CTP:molybdopterin cytidylyltransferase MocA